jgi:hypothetical protein
MASFDFNQTAAVIDGTTTTTYQPVDFTDANVAKHLEKDVNVAALATDAEISLDGLTVKHLRLVCGATISVKLNGTGNTAIALTPNADHPAVLCLIGCNVTSIHVTNTGASAVELKLIAMAE